MDADAIRRETELVRADWAGRGRHWDRRADEIAEQAARMNAPLIEAADIATGQQVCDIATGAGEPALSVAVLVGAEGRVFATDLCPEMVLGARRRAAAQGLRNITFRTADMLALPDADSAFDRVICRFGLMFCPAPARAAAEALRVLKPGGRVAYLVWGPREETTMFVVFVAAAEAVLGPLDEVEEIDLARPFSLGAPGALATALTEGGLTPCGGARGPLRAPGPGGGPLLAGPVRHDLRPGAGWRRGGQAPRLDDSGAGRLRAP